MAGGGLAEDAAVGALPVERETRAITLRADELEVAVHVGLGDVGIEREFSRPPLATWRAASVTRLPRDEQES